MHHVVEYSSKIDLGEKSSTAALSFTTTITEHFNPGRVAGFTSRLRIVPMPHSLVPQAYSMEAWSRFRDRDSLERLRLKDQLASHNYWGRVIFYVDKPE